MANLEIASFPNQDGRGTHVNISGAGVTKCAPNRAKRDSIPRVSDRVISRSASSPKAIMNTPFPGPTTGPGVIALGEFKRDDLNVAVLGENQTEAVKVYDRAGWK